MNSLLNIHFCLSLGGPDSIGAGSPLHTHTNKHCAHPTLTFPVEESLGGMGVWAHRTGRWAVMGPQLWLARSWLPRGGRE